MKRLLKWLLILGIIGGALFGASIPLGQWLKKRAEPRYITAKITRGRVETVVNSTGTVKPVRSVSVGAFTSGPIAKINVDFNDVVKKDDVVALIDPMLAEAAVARDRAALEAQKADLKRVEAMLRKAENDEERAKKLQAVKKDFLSDSDMDTYHFTRLQNQAMRDLGLATIAQAEAALKNSITNLGYTKIISPVEGIVIERKVDPGQTVAASFQTPEMFIIAPEMDKHMYIYANVDEADIGQIYKGQEVKFTVDAYTTELFTGNVYQVRNNSTTTQNVVTYPVVIDAPNSVLKTTIPASGGTVVPSSSKEAPRYKLMPGMTANISFQLEARENVLRIPIAALRFVPIAAQVRPEDRHLVATPTTGTESAPKNSATAKSEKAKSRQNRTVWVQEGPFLKAVPVTLGLIENQFAEIVSGDLVEDQAVVTGLESALTPR